MQCNTEVVGRRGHRTSDDPIFPTVWWTVCHPSDEHVSRVERGGSPLRQSRADRSAALSAVRCPLSAVIIASIDEE